MSSTARRDAIQHVARRLPVLIPADEANVDVTEIFGIDVFNDQVQRARLPRPVYAALRETIDSGKELEPGIAAAVATGMKDWAVENGATHFTHWFQPMTGLTAEKHDTFIRLVDEGRIITEFSGSELIQGEPDASSFPSGGLRATFEARGYTAWDPTSPAFLRAGPNGFTLCIPTAFCSWTGEALDKKTPLLRSNEALNDRAVKLLQLIGNHDVQHVRATCGNEQEYFLVDRELAALRPDLTTTGRTLFGARPPKGQELDDHYFGTISTRVLAFMQDVEIQLWKLGIPVKTRHNEVAPGQFELAPIFESITVAIDHNMLVMQLLKEVAERHGFRCLLHEKPFAGLNGSGKHTNWSLQDNQGNNLLEPGSTPHESMQFMLILTAIVRAVDLHADLLRLSIAHAANDHRLGANEAPPGIISIFLGRQLEGIVEAIRGHRTPSSGDAGEIRLGANTLPSIPKDITDRNRTSPFAFTGNKFEFRAVGSSQSTAYPAIFLNSIVAESLEFLHDEIKKNNGRGDMADVIQELVAETLEKHHRVLFSGDNYSDDWTLEAERRGLLNLRDTTAALPVFTETKNIELFKKLGVFSEREVRSRQNVMYENYITALSIEAHSSFQVASTMILPAALKYQRSIADSIRATLEVMGDADVASQKDLLRLVAGLASDLRRGIDELDSLVNRIDESEASLPEKALACRQQLVPAMDWIRERADRLEDLIDDAEWPLPKYREMLTIL